MNGLAEVAEFQIGSHSSLTFCKFLQSSPCSSYELRDIVAFRRPKRTSPPALGSLWPTAMSAYHASYIIPVWFRCCILMEHERYYLDLLQRLPTNAFLSDVSAFTVSGGSFSTVIVCNNRAVNVVFGPPPILKLPATGIWSFSYVGQSHIVSKICN